MSLSALKVPDFGDDEGEGAEIIEVCVTPGARVNKEDSLLVLESEKASFEMPSPFDGEIKSIKVKVGDIVKEGMVIGDILVEQDSVATDDVKEEQVHTDPELTHDVEHKNQVSSNSNQDVINTLMDLTVPEFGDDGEGAEIIEISVKSGDDVKKEDALLVLESDKATFEMPSPADGKIKSITVQLGDTVKEGLVIGELLIEASGDSPSQQNSVKHAPSQQTSGVSRGVQDKKNNSSKRASTPRVKTTNSKDDQVSVYAGPAVRRLARDLGVDLGRVSPSGPRQRITKDDLYDYVKKALNSPDNDKQPTLPAIDFSKFGEIKNTPLNKLRQVSVRNLTRSWITIPHVTQFDEADITNLEITRKSSNKDNASKGIKLTLPIFLVKACVSLLKRYPDFNASLHFDGKTLIHKDYYHIGMAVDTPNGLLVPVLKNADQKDIFEISKEIKELAMKARDGKLMPQDMQGGTFSITSLGGIGGTAFTPIVNWPEVAIMGLSKAVYKPVYNGKEFEPRLMLPISLSYDHRVIDGVAAAKFTSELVELLSNPESLIERASSKKPDSAPDS